VGISASDWERVLQARRDEPDIERLRRLGPQLQPGEIGAVTSDVGVRRSEKRRWLEIRTACVRTATGYRYSQAALPKPSSSNCMCCCCYAVGWALN
jgi:hypothetical protein